MSISLNRITLFVALVVLSGCTARTTETEGEQASRQSAANVVDVHDVPLTEAEKQAIREALVSFPTALEVISAHRDQISNSLASGDSAAAHRPLDELDIVLEYLPNVARDDQIPRTHWETINTTAQALRELFNEVHAQIDAGQQPQFDAIASDVDAAFAQLESVNANANTP